MTDFPLPSPYREHLRRGAAKRSMYSGEVEASRSVPRIEIDCFDDSTLGRVVLAPSRDPERVMFDRAGLADAREAKRLEWLGYLACIASALGTVATCYGLYRFCEWMALS